MIENAYLFFPLLAAAVYAVGALQLKRAERCDVPAAALTFYSTFAAALGAAVFYPWSAFPALPAVAWPVVAVGLAFAVGQVFTLLAFTRGDVTVAAPAMGTKALFAAVLASVFAGALVRPGVWAGGVAMVVGLALLVGVPATGDRRRVATGLAYALVSAFCFASCDVLVQIWSPRLGFGLVIFPGLLLGALLSTGLPWLMPGSRRGGRGAFHVPAGARLALALGAGLIAAQSLLLVWAIGTFGDAAGANVVYASRGVFSVLVVQFVPALAAGETFGGRGVFVRRFAGACVMAVGVYLAFR